MGPLYLVFFRKFIYPLEEYFFRKKSSFSPSPLTDTEEKEKDEEETYTLFNFSIIYFLFRCDLQDNNDDGIINAHISYPYTRGYGGGRKKRIEKNFLLPKLLANNVVVCERELIIQPFLSSNSI